MLVDFYNKYILEVYLFLAFGSPGQYAPIVLPSRRPWSYDDEYIQYLCRYTDCSVLDITVTLPIKYCTFESTLAFHGNRFERSLAKMISLYSIGQGGKSVPHVARSNLE